MADKKFTLTQKYLKEIVHYDPDTGIFTRIKRTANCVHIGDIAGCVFYNGAGKKYIRIKIKCKPYKAHRLAFFYMKGYWPIEIDHDDGNGLNNKWGNLFDVTHLNNCRNKRLSVRNKSGCSGVDWHKRIKKWQARITINYKELHLGYFLKINDAIKTRKAAEKKYGFHPNHGQVRPL